ncbi:MAG: DUF2149 domain-containing protein [Proteobacteria bacterium]|nr:DUF2149 domain-containing protein [Pseudomonadota bacterium]
MRSAPPRRLAGRVNRGLPEADDPLSAVANLVDVFLVFIVGLLLSFLSAYHLKDLLDPKSELTMMKQSAAGEMTVISKKGTKIEAVKITKSEAEGRGTRLGVAYRLEDGSMVYLPDEGK